MNGNKVLEIAERKGLLDAKTLRKLRTQLDAADRPVSAERILKLLLKRNLVTTSQAKMLLKEVGGEADGGTDRNERRGAVPGPAAKKGSQGTSKGSTKRRDANPKPRGSTNKSGDRASSRQDDVADLQPIDSSPELVPVDSSPELTPIDSSPELTPIDSAAELQPVDSALLQPVSQPATPRKEKRAEPVASREMEDVQLDAPLDSQDDLSSWDAPDASAESLGAVDHDEPAPTDRLGAKPSSKKKGLLARLGIGSKKADRLGKKTAKGWDSPLMLVGSGALMLMVALGVFLFFFLNRGTGDEMFNLAEEAYRQQSYVEAVSSYQAFLDRFPNHPKASLARVRQGMARLRQAVDSSKDWQRAMEIANDQLPKIKTEEAFDDARPELGTLLTNIYGGFVDQAEQAEDTAAKANYLAQAQAAMKLVDNPEYLPSSIRTGQQPKIEQISDRIVLIERDINRDKELASAIEQIKQATEQREIGQAYAVRRDLLAKYPGVQNNPQLREVVRAITLAEKAKVMVHQESRAAATGARTSPVSRTVVLADRQTAGAGASGASAIVPTLIEGAAYGIDASDGRILWRTWLGYTSRIAPIPVSADPDADVLLVDSVRHELLRVRARSGEVVWRQAVGSPMTAPVVLGSQAFVSTEDGRVWSIQLETGESTHQAQLPQTHLAPLAVDADHGFVYAAGQHSSMYVLEADTLQCAEVAYVGHKPDSMQVPPARAGGYVFVVENEGAGASTLHVFLGDASGLTLQSAREPQRLDGRVLVPMVVFGRRVLVSTDRGGMYVFDVDPANTAEPVRVMARTLPSAGDRFVQHVAVENGQVFVAGRQLARFELQASRGELIRKWAGLDGESFVGPIHLRGDVLVHARRKKGSDATVVEATRMSLGRQTSNEGEALWSTTLAAAPAMEVQYDTQRRSLVVISSTGTLWDVDAEAMSSGYLDQAAARADVGLDGPLGNPASLSSGRAVLTPDSLSTHLVLYDPESSERVRSVKLPIPHDKLSCPPIAIGQALVVCSAEGPVHVTSMDSSQMAVMPFQPKLSAGMSVQWLRPAVVDADRPLLVAGERGGVLYLLGVEAAPNPHLAAVATRQLSGQLTAELAVLGDQLIVVQREGNNDKVLALALPDMQQEQAVDVSGQVVAGPMRIGDLVLLATSDGVLHAIGATGQVAWKTPLPYGPLAGAPLEDGGRLILVSSSGHVWQVASHSGEVLPWSGAGTAGSGNSEEPAGEPGMDIGEPLSGRAVVMGPRLFLLGRDGTLFIADVPAGPDSRTGRRP